MLTTLHIENFAIVSRLELEFTEGMSVLTGETGAGKSIMIDALLLALGGRGDSSCVRPGALKCQISACFSVDSSSEPTRWLMENDLATEGHEIILRRVISAEGRSRAYINGQLFPLQKIKELSVMLVDIHGQHQHQTLLKHQTHRQQLDCYANNQELLNEVAKKYKVCQELQKKLQQMQNNAESIERKELLEYQLAEISNLDVKEGELEKLNEQHQLLHNSCAYLEKSQQVIQLLDGDDHLNVRNMLNQAQQILQQLPAKNRLINNSIDLLNNALIQCSEAIDEINQFSEQISIEPDVLAVIEERLSLLHQAARKYKIEPKELPVFAATLAENIAKLTNECVDKEHLAQELLDAEVSYNRAAEKLRESRVSAAVGLCDEITSLMRQLGMPKGFIKIVITPLEKMQMHGQDKVEYFVSTNPGIEANTLTKVASGGELSRISLAIEMITAKRGATPTLLFDEVDVGIGGATAALVGGMLRTLSTRLQVFCVTHQPQVAAKAHHHFKVEKRMDNQHTYSVVTKLNSAEKIDEVARMLGGLTITDHTRLNAREMIEQ